MSKKKYISTTGIQYTFPVATGSKVIFISFKGNENEYVTSNAEIQKEIEASNYFRDKLITLAGDHNSTANSSSATARPAKTVEEVTDLQSAKAYLIATGIPAAALTTPARIRTQATRAGVSFPNLKED